MLLLVVLVVLLVLLAAQAALDHGLGVLGDEARALVEEEQINEAVPHDHLVEGAQEQLAGLRGSRAASLPLAQAARQRCSVRTLMCTKRPSRSTRSAPATWRTAAPAGHPPSTRASTSATTE